MDLRTDLRDPVTINEYVDDGKRDLRVGRRGVRVEREDMASLNEE
jgi:hypothetical protein